MKKSDIQIILGSHRLSDITNKDRQDRKVAKWWLHDSFKAKTYSNDIALIHMDRKVRFSSNIRPVCLPLGTSKLKSKNSESSMIIEIEAARFISTNALFWFPQI